MVILTGIVLSIILFKGDLFWIALTTLTLAIIFLLLTILVLHVSTKEVLISNNHIIILRKTGVRKKIKIEDVLDILVSEISSVVAQYKKNKGTYYCLYLKLKNGKNVMISEVLHITTLINFLKMFLKYHNNRLPEQCIAHIQKFIKEKEHILKRFEGMAKNVGNKR